jgi:hypothetical protein
MGRVVQRKSRDELWREVSREVGGEFVGGGFCKGPKVRARVEPWTITLDSYTDTSSESHQQYTRLRAPYVRREGFLFTIYRKGVFTELGKRLGMQDIEVGAADFDDAFVIQGSDAIRIQKLFGDRDVRRLVLAQPKIRLEVKKQRGWPRPKVPDDVDVLQCMVPGVVKDAVRLKGLFDLFATVLEQLCKIGSAERREPGVTL